MDPTIIAHTAGVRNPAALRDALADGAEKLGKLDIVVANAGICQASPALELADEAWQETIDISLTGAWNTAKAALPRLIASGGGSIVMISSVAGLKALPVDAGKYIR